jgi:hypothetical protein
MGKARDLARLSPNSSGQLPDANLLALAANKLSGVIPDANAPSGSVIQVTQGYRQDVQTFTGFGFTTFATAIDHSITPRSTSNFVLVSAYIAMGADSLSDNATPGFRLTRNGTPIAVGSGAGSRVPATAAHQTNTQSNVQGMNVYSVTFLDSPSSTSPVTYAIQVQNRNTGQTVSVGRNWHDVDSQEQKRLPTILLLQEIQA